MGNKTARSKCSPSCCNGLQDLAEGLAPSAIAPWWHGAPEVAQLGCSHPLKG